MYDFAIRTGMVVAELLWIDVRTWDQAHWITYSNGKGTPRGQRFRGIEAVMSPEGGLPFQIRTRGRVYVACAPPGTRIVWPVIHLASGAHRRATTPATSSGKVGMPSGLVIGFAASICCRVVSPSAPGS